MVLDLVELNCGKSVGLVVKNLNVKGKIAFAGSVPLLADLSLVLRTVRILLVHLLSWITS